jgi:peptide/nickel transport system permease protein
MIRFRDLLEEVTIQFLQAIGIARKYPRIPIAIVIIGLFLASAVGAPWIAPYSPIKIDLSSVYEQPSSDHLLGTDYVGRDVFSRLIYGSRNTLYSSVFSILLATIIGIILGTSAGFFGGGVDVAIGRFIDIILTLPSFIISIVLMGVLGRGLINMIVAIGIGISPRIARVARGSALSIKESDFVEAARSYSCSNARILIRHIIPHCLTPVLVYSTLSLGSAVMLESGLSFLGLGIPPPTPTWGKTISEGVDVMRTMPWISIAGGGCIMMLVLGFNLLGDGVRDALDPRTRRQFMA